MRIVTDATVVAGDNYAAGCLPALKQKGIKIPMEISFVGSNKDPVSRLIEPKLSTINCSDYQVDELYARQPINHLDRVDVALKATSVFLHDDLLDRISFLKRKDGNYLYDGSIGLLPAVD